MPTFLYGTAWKEEKTAFLVTEALRAGFRGIDTANQRRHYNEAEVGRALLTEFGEGVLWRDDVFLQTKFTFRPAQDYRLPYDPAAPIAQQVVQSLNSSLDHLGVETIDSLLLHGPSQRWGLAAADMEAWNAMEGLHTEGKVRLLGASNFSSDQLRQLLARASVPPAFLQNRCFAALGWDRAVRRICDAEGVVYQGFSLLTANAEFIQLPVVHSVARRHGRTLAQIVFRFALQAGMIPLTGTSSYSRMREDLQIYDFQLEPEEVASIERVGA